MEVRISYETLFDILRREKSREELQALDDSFYEDVLAYMKDKSAVLDGEDSMFSNREKDSVRAQLENIRKIMRELFDRRENKIIRMAQDKALSGKAVVVNLLPEEKEFFDTLVKTLSSSREQLLNRLLELKSASPTMTARPSVSSAPALAQSADPAEPLSTPAVEHEKKVRILSPLPKFLGKDLSVYGPYDQDEQPSLPSEIADLLIRKGRAEEA